MFYDRFKCLCDDVGVSCNKVATDLGLSNATPTAWKKRRLTPKGETIAKIADYFQVPIDFFLERPPFDYWDAINNDRKGFLRCANITPEVLSFIAGIDAENPEAASARGFILVLSAVVESAYPRDDGSWAVTLTIQRNSSKIEETPAPEGRCEISDSLIKATFFKGLDSSLTEEEMNAVWDDAKSYMQYKIAQRKKAD